MAKEERVTKPVISKFELSSKDGGCMLDQKLPGLCSNIALNSFPSSMKRGLSKFHEESGTVIVDDDICSCLSATEESCASDEAVKFTPIDCFPEPSFMTLAPIEFWEAAKCARVIYHTTY